MSWWRRGCKNVVAAEADARVLIDQHGKEARDAAVQLARSLRRRDRETAKHYAHVALCIAELEGARLTLTADANSEPRLYSGRDASR